MKILFFGDLVGKTARFALKKVMPIYKEKYGFDLAIANCDNLAHGKGVTKNTIKEILGYGIDVLTCGDHIWDTSEAVEILQNKKEYNLICPANFPMLDQKKGYSSFQVKDKKVLIMNLAGRVFFQRYPDCPFRTAEKILDENRDKADIILVDFHGEATSEKKAFVTHFASRVSAVLGTHTHVQTADEEILKEGAAFISDVGMVGPKDSIIGCKKEIVIEQILHQIPFRYDISEDRNALINAVLLEFDDESSKVRKIERINELVKHVF